MRQILFILPIALLMLLPAVLLLVLVCRALLAYIRSKKIREEKNAVKTPKAMNRQTGALAY